MGSRICAGEVGRVPAAAGPRFSIAFLSTLWHSALRAASGLRVFLGALLILPLSAAESATKAQQQLTEIAVANLPGDAPDQAGHPSLAAALRESLLKEGRFRVVSADYMKHALDVARRPDLDRCGETSCLVELGKLLDVNAVLGGKLDPGDSRTSVRLQLIRVETGEEIWTYEHIADDPKALADLSDAIVGEVASQFGSKATSAPGLVVPASRPESKRKDKTTTSATAATTTVAAESTGPEKTPSRARMEKKDGKENESWLRRNAVWIGGGAAVALGVAVSGGGGGGSDGGGGDSNVVGRWIITDGYWAGETFTLHSNGSLSAGGGGDSATGSYSTSGSNITLRYNWNSGATRTMTGHVSGDTMHGSYVDSCDCSPHGSWSAARN